MAKFPTEVERSVTVPVPLEKAYTFFWDVAGSSSCIPGIDRCEPAGENVYRFIYKPRSTGPVSMTVRYTSRYEGNGKDTIRFESTAAEGDNTDVLGSIRLEGAGAGATKVTLKQMLAPDTPVPRLVQGLVRGLVEGEAAKGVEEYLANVKRTLGG